MTKVYTKMLLKVCINNKYRDTKAKMIISVFIFGKNIITFI